jgi:flagellar hook-associated protein 2
MLSSPGIGSGLDVKGIVEQLMAIERQPLTRLGTRQVEISTQISAYGALKSAVSAFQTAIDKLNDLSKFKVYKATSSDDTILTATASSSAAKGSYTLLVNRIAENHRMSSATTFADSGSTTIGAAGATMTIGVGGDSFTVEYGAKTLANIRDAINQAGNNTGVTASIIKDDSGYRLLLAANETGAGDALTVSYSAADPFSLTTLNADRDQSGGFTSADLNASVQLEGQYTITSRSNSLTDTIDGVSVTLKKAGTVTLSVDRDTAAVQKSVEDFAKAYSDLVKTITKMSNEALRSDRAALLDIEAQLRGVLNSNLAAVDTFANVFEVGLSTQKDGTLSVNATVLSDALGADFGGVAALFADADNGVAVRLSALADDFLATGGLLDGRTVGLQAQANRLDDQKATIEQRLTIIEQRYLKQFAALDTLVSSLTSTSNFLTQQLTMLTNNAANITNR